jgi:hypothetical protein
MTRQVLYKFKTRKEVPERMAMNIFEEHLIKDCTDIPRIISETIQLENYIFRVEDEPAIVTQDTFLSLEEPVNDLDLGMKILLELGKEV